MRLRICKGDLHDYVCVKMKTGKEQVDIELGIRDRPGSVIPQSSCRSATNRKAGDQKSLPVKFLTSLPLHYGRIFQSIER